MVYSSSRLCLLCLIVASLAIQAMANSHESKSESESDSAHLADSPEVSSESEEEKHSDKASAITPSSRPLGGHKTDKSMAGGGVIIGGLATVLFAAVFCYIRVTRKRNTEI